MAARPHSDTRLATEQTDLEDGLAEAMTEIAQAAVPPGIADAAEALATALAAASGRPLPVSAPPEKGAPTPADPAPPDE